MAPTLRDVSSFAAWPGGRSDPRVARRRGTQPSFAPDSQPADGSVPVGGPIWRGDVPLREGGGERTTPEQLLGRTSGATREKRGGCPDTGANLERSPDGTGRPCTRRCI